MRLFLGTQYCPLWSAVVVPVQQDTCEEEGPPAFSSLQGRLGSSWDFSLPWRLENQLVGFDEKLPYWEFIGVVLYLCILLGRIDICVILYGLDLGIPYPSISFGLLPSISFEFYDFLCRGCISSHVLILGPWFLAPISICFQKIHFLSSSLLDHLVDFSKVSSILHLSNYQNQR